MKNILFIQNTADIGGATIKLFELINHLDRAQYIPSVILLSDGDAKNILEGQGVKVYVCRDITTYPHAEGAYFPFKSFRPWYQISKLFAIIPSALRLRSFISQLNIDLVIINSSDQIPSLLAVHMLGIKCVLHLREVLRKGAFGFRRVLFRYIIDKCPDRIISIANYNASQINKSAKVSVIYDSVNMNNFNSNINNDQIRKKYQSINNNHVVGFLGGIVPHKGLSILIHSAKIIKEQYHDTCFVVAGTPPTPDVPTTFKRKVRHKLEDWLKIPNPNRDILNLLTKYKLHDSFIFTGPRLNVNQIISTFDVLVFPITESHFGNPILEAGAMKIPVVASDFPSTREIIYDNKTGYLVPPNDPETLAQKILVILKDKKLSKSIANNAHKLVLKKFDLQENIIKVYKIYDELIL